MDGGRNAALVRCVVLIFISGGGLVCVVSGGLTSNGMRETVFTASFFECVVIDGSVTSEIESFYKPAPQGIGKLCFWTRFCCHDRLHC
jgi:hypothetical protein